MVFSMKAAIAVLAVAAILGAAVSASARSAAPDPPRFTTVLHAVSTDEAKIASDLRGERADAAAGPNGAGEPACYNLVNNVDDDAVRSIAGFVVNNVVADRNNVQG